MGTTLAIDYGSRYIGLALVQHTADQPNQVLYAAILEVNRRALDFLVEPRTRLRRLRRTRRTLRRRLRRLGQALGGIPNAAAIVRFCRRRGYSHETKPRASGGPPRFHLSRAKFFAALHQEVARLVPQELQERVMTLCSRHLNEARRPQAEVRPARFLNRRPSKCRWAGCDQNAPRAENDLRGRLWGALLPWMLPVFAHSQDQAGLRKSLSHWLDELNALGLAYRKAARREDAKASLPAVRKSVMARMRCVYKHLLTRVQQEAPKEVAARFTELWKGQYRAAVSDIILKRRVGRSRFCRDHARAFIEYRLAGQPVPAKLDVTEADLPRRLAILFSRIWSLVEKRLLPLAGGCIDRVVVERVSFDFLAAAPRARGQFSDEQLAAMYRDGPQRGFASRLDMLNAEFGRCAYCGRQGVVEEVEHYLPRCHFPFDGYFNVLPSCAACNRRKGPRTGLGAGMTIHADAVAAYRAYVEQRRTPHLFHRLKLDLLELLAQPTTAATGEEALLRLAAGLSAAGESQRSPRPLARYLATKLAGLTGQRPTIELVPGRQTALYRSLVMPEFDKQERKRQGDLREHAVDAILLGCAFPPAPRWGEGNALEGACFWAWAGAVRAAGPKVSPDGLPCVEPAGGMVRYWEAELGGGYRHIDVSSFNWNRRRKGTHVGNPFGETADGQPLQRKPAEEVLAALKDDRQRGKQISNIAHRGLRELLQRERGNAPAVLVDWLQQSVRAGLAEAAPARHPSDQARRLMLEQFAAALVDAVVAGQEPIPGVIGVRVVKRGSHGRLHVVRLDRTGHVLQRFHACPVIREAYVGYWAGQDGTVDRQTPLVLVVTQGWRLMELRGKVKVALSLPAGSPLNGQDCGSVGRGRWFQDEWRRAFERFCEQEGLVEVFRLTQGCVVVTEDGRRWQLKNFDNAAPWMIGQPFVGILGVLRSPLAEGPGQGGQHGEGRSRDRPPSR